VIKKGRLTERLLSGRESQREITVKIIHRAGILFETRFEPHAVADVSEEFSRRNEGVGVCVGLSAQTFEQRVGEDSVAAPPSFVLKRKLVDVRIARGAESSASESLI